MAMAFRGFQAGIPFPQIDAFGALASPVTPEPVKPGFFSRGGGIADLVGGLADGVIAANGGRPVYQPMQQQRLERQRQLQDYERKRADDLAQWQAEQQFKIDHPAPVNNDTVNDYGFIEGKLGREAADQYLRNMGDPVVTVQLPGDRVYNGPRSGLATAMGAFSGAGAAPQAPVGKLTPLGGGAAPTASRPFPLRPSTR